MEKGAAAKSARNGGGSLRTTKHGTSQPVNLLQGESFNRTLVAAPLNISKSKASFAFSKAKRFSHITVNEQGYAVAMLNKDASPTTKPSANMISNSSLVGVGTQRAIKPLNMQSASLEQLDAQKNSDLDDYDGVDGDAMTDNQAKFGRGLSHISSIERLHGGRNSKMTQAFTHKNSSMVGRVSHRNRARSTVTGPQANAPFHSSGPRFTTTPKQCK